MTKKVMASDKEVTESKFFAIFGTSGRYLTNLRGSFVAYVKEKSKIILK
jgi:hypothetical protein